MARGARMRAVLVAALTGLALGVFAPAAAAGQDCKTKKGPRFPVKMSGSEDSKSAFDSGTYTQTTQWSAKWKRVRMWITRCDGRLHRITLDSATGEIETSIDYHEPDEIIEPDDCAPGAFCPRRAWLALGDAPAQVIPGCNFSHSGTYEARLGLNAYFTRPHNVVVTGGPFEERLAKEERQSQMAACGDAGKVGYLGVPKFASDGFKWDISGYFATLTADSVPDLIRDVARGRGGRASAERTRREESRDGSTTETTTVKGSLKIGESDKVRNRFPNGFSASTSGALNAVLAYDPARFDTLDDLNTAMNAPGEINVAGLRRQLRSGDFDRRWAATYVAHAVADDPPDLRALRPRLRDGSASIRALAAFGLAGFGDKRGLPVLVALTGSPELMVRSDIEAVAALAEERLRLLTRARLKGARAWGRWWREVRRNIRWDRGAKRYRWRRERGRGRGATSARTATDAPVAHTAADPVKVPLKVQLLFDPFVTAAEKRAILRNLDKAIDILNAGSQTGRCKPIELELDLVVEGELLPDYVSISVNEIPKANAARWSTSWIDSENKTGRFWTERAAGDIGPVLIAHELAHIAGLPDEYYERTDSQGRTSTVPIDPTSIMGGPDGTILQRHLDYLSRLHDPAGAAGCERWALRFPAWTSELEAWTDESGDTTTNWLGLTAVASIDAGFWVDQDGTILPAGYLPCGSEVFQGRTAGHPSGRNTPCREAGGNSVGDFANAIEGEADCASPGPRLFFDPVRFDTAVSGSRQGDSFRFRLTVDDAEQAEATRCEPAAEPSITKRYRLIRDGMRFAGALNFTMSPPSREFLREADHKTAEGRASLVRLE